MEVAVDEEEEEEKDEEITYCLGFLIRK